MIKGHLYTRSTSQIKDQDKKNYVGVKDMNNLLI